LVELYRKALSNLQVASSNRNAAQGFQEAAQSASVKTRAIRDICAVAIFGSSEPAAVSALADEVPRQDRKTGEQRAREGEQARSMRIIPIHTK
jgi:hypothetical protein